MICRPKDVEVEKRGKAQVNGIGKANGKETN